TKIKPKKAEKRMKLTMHTTVHACLGGGGSGNGGVSRSATDRRRASTLIDSVIVEVESSGKRTGNLYGNRLTRIRGRYNEPTDNSQGQKKSSLQSHCVR